MQWEESSGRQKQMGGQRTKNRKGNYSNEIGTIFQTGFNIKANNMFSA